MALQASTLVDMPFQDLDGCAELRSVEGRGQLDGLDGDGPRGKIRRELDQPALGEIISKKDIATDKVALTRACRQQAGGRAVRDQRALDRDPDPFSVNQERPAVGVGIVGVENAPLGCQLVGMAVHPVALDRHGTSRVGRS